ncbi:MAG: V-type ATP synthase subunit E [Thermoplasmata archaeon]|nr:V-type ATP synthase subunit E [Thermoplasmata archaeon]
MTLERLVAEIQSKGAAELEAAQHSHAQQTAQLAAERDRRVRELREATARQAQEESNRERQRRLAGAKMQARKLEYEARERALGSSLNGARQLLGEYTHSSDYPEVLRRMYGFAVDRLGKDLRVTGRVEDASLLKSIAGRGFDPAPVPILGGLVAESADRDRRLTLSFDELLRLHESQLRELLAS